MTRRRSVAFVGLGAMGLPMATHVARSTDVELRVFDVSDAAMNRARGVGEPVGSLMEAVIGADIVVTMLPADANLAQVVSVIRDTGTAGQVLLDLSTIHPATIEAADTNLSEAGVAVVAGTCMKSVAAAQRGDLTIFVGADQPTALDQVRPVLEAMSSVCIDVGTPRAAKVLKIVNNLQVAGLNLAISEALVLAARAGITYEQTASDLLDRGLGGWALAHHTVEHVVADNLGPGRFPVRYMAKDVRLAADLATDYGQPRFLSGALLAAYRGASSMGLSNHYHPIIVRWLEACAGPSRHRGETPKNAAVMDTVVRWLESAEFLVASHGLAIAEATGSNPQQAASHLITASAVTESLKSMATDGPTNDRRTIEHVLASVRQCIGVADELGLPAVTMEISYDYGRELARGSGT